MVAERDSDEIFFTCIVCEHQLRLFGYVAVFPDADPAHQILSMKLVSGAETHKEALLSYNYDD